MGRFVSVAAGLGACAACSAAQAAVASYRCDDGSRLTAVFAGGTSAPGTAKITFADGSIMTLPQTVSADGGRYASGATEFWIKGRGATLTRDGRATGCTTSR